MRRIAVLIPLLAAAPAFAAPGGAAPPTPQGGFASPVPSGGFASPVPGPVPPGQVGPRPMPPGLVEPPHPVRSPYTYRPYRYRNGALPPQYRPYPHRT